MNIKEEDLHFSEEFYDALCELKLVHLTGIKKYKKNDWKTRSRAEHYSHAIDHLKQAVTLGIESDLHGKAAEEAPEKKAALNEEISHAIIRLMMFYQQRLEM